jgi:hypothetical protein
LLSKVIVGLGVALISKVPLGTGQLITQTWQNAASKGRAKKEENIEDNTPQRLRSHWITTRNLVLQENGIQGSGKQYEQHETR